MEDEMMNLLVAQDSHWAWPGLPVPACHAMAYLLKGLKNLQV